MKIFGGIKKMTDYYTNPMPRKYWIDIYSKCNLRCVMCPQSQDDLQRKTKMSLNTFKDIIDNIYDNQPLIKLYFSGEPLLHDELFDMIEYASEKGCRTMVHTNATLLTEDVSLKLLSSSLTYISFSFDGCSPEVYERLRPPAKFEKVKSNIHRYLELRRSGSTVGPHTSIEIIRMKDTNKLIKEFVAEWKTSGVDKVRIRKYMTWLGSVDDRHNKQPGNYGYKPCYHPFESGCILSDGTVVPCCLDFYGQIPLGNVLNNSFRDIWFGNEYRRLRQYMLKGRFPEGFLCNGCYKTYSKSRREKIELYVPRLLAIIKEIFRK